MTAALLALGAANVWIAWNYAKTPLSQDEALWLLWAITGSRPYRDQIDCKPPGIHLWFWLLARLCAGRIPIVKFTHHFAIGCCAVYGAAITHNVAVGIAFTALGQSAWLCAYHAELEGLSAALLLLAMLSNPWPGGILFALAIATNLKLALPALFYLVLRQSFAQTAALIGGGVLAVAAVRLCAPGFFADLRYALLTVPQRMLARRNGRKSPFGWEQQDFVPLLLVIPAVAAAIVARPDADLWIPALVYVIVNAAGRVWRPYHWLPVAAFVAVAGSPYALYALAAEWFASGFYLGDVVERTRPGRGRLMHAARAIGERLAQVPGSLYVCDPCTQVYIYARKQPALGFVEQVEICDVIDERRETERNRIRDTDLIVFGPGSIAVAPPGFVQVMARDGFVVLARQIRRGR